MEDILLEIHNRTPRGRPLSRPTLPPYLQQSALNAVEKPLADLYAIYRTAVGKNAKGTHFTQAACKELRLRPIAARRVLLALGYIQWQTRLPRVGPAKVWRRPEDKHEKPT
jgi:S-adenosylmethionine:tRNA-ribosyltransferase-isomerase (queuine synthetase)